MLVQTVRKTFFRTIVINVKTIEILGSTPNTASEWKLLSHVWLFATPWIVPVQSPLSTGFSRQEYWSGLPCPPPGDLPDLGIKLASPVSPVLQTDSLPLEPLGKPGQNPWVSCHSLLQGIFPIQESNPGLPYWRWILYQLRHQGSSRILEWVAYPFSSRSSWPRNQTRISCIAGRFFTIWATREALLFYSWGLFHCIHVPHLFFIHFHSRDYLQRFVQEHRNPLRWCSNSKEEDAVTGTQRWGGCVEGMGDLKRALRYVWYVCAICIWYIYVSNSMTLLYIWN